MLDEDTIRLPFLEGIGNLACLFHERVVVPARFVVRASGSLRVLVGCG
jgi:hypothetical protein